MCLHFDVRVSLMNESRVSTSDEVCDSKATRPSRLQDLCSVFTSVISSTIHWRKQMTISPGLIVHQQPAQSTEEVWSLYPDTHDVISSGFKEFNSTLMKTKIQTRSSSRYLERLPVQSLELATRRKIQSISKRVPVNRGVLKTLEGFYRLSKNH